MATCSRYEACRSAWDSSVSTLAASSAALSWLANVRSLSPATTSASSSCSIAALPCASSSRACTLAWALAAARSAAPCDSLSKASRDSTFAASWSASAPEELLALSASSSDCTLAASCSASSRDCTFEASAALSASSRDCTLAATCSASARCASICSAFRSSRSRALARDNSVSCSAFSKCMILSFSRPTSAAWASCSPSSALGGMACISRSAVSSTWILPICCSTSALCESRSWSRSAQARAAASSVLRMADSIESTLAFSCSFSALCAPSIA